MTRRSIITSSANDRLKAVRRLARRRDRGAFVVEGHRQLRRALEGHAALHAVYAAPDLFLGAGDAELVRLAERRGADVVELGAAAFRSISSGARPDGLLAVAARWPTPLRSIPVDPSPLLLVAQGIERPGNLGTIVRTACAAGATGLVCCDPQTDVFHPRTVSASVGGVFRLPLAVAAAAETVAWLRAHRIRIVVASPVGSLPPWGADLAGPVAVVFGCEKRGVTSTWLDAADDVVGIPMPGEAMDSLNVAVAAGVVLFEAARQRLAAT